MADFAAVVRLLLNNGWRWERLPGCERSMLVNAPRGKRWCTECGDWKRIRDFSRQTGTFYLCDDCRLERARAYHDKGNTHKVHKM